VNPRRTPQRIRGGHVANQRANVLRHGRAAGPVAALPRPEQAKAAPVPRDDGLRLDDVHRRAPAAPCVREPRPQHAVDRRQTKAWASGSIHDGQLVSERDDSRCSEARERTVNRSEWSSETTTDDTTAAIGERPQPQSTQCLRCFW